MKNRLSNLSNRQKLKRRSPLNRQHLKNPRSNPLQKLQLKHQLKLRLKQLLPRLLLKNLSKLRVKPQP